MTPHKIEELVERLRDIHDECDFDGLCAEAAQTIQALMRALETIRTKVEGRGYQPVKALYEIDEIARQALSKDDNND